MVSVFSLCLGHTAAVRLKTDLPECLKDEDYNELLDTMKSGLPPTPTPRHVAIVGAGMAGLTAAKLLRGAGHKVGHMQQTASIRGIIA